MQKSLTIAELREIGKKASNSHMRTCFCMGCDSSVQMRNLWDSLLDRLEAAENDEMLAMESMENWRKRALAAEKPWVELTKETMPEPKRNAEFSDGVASVIGWYSDETGCVTWLIVNAVVQTPIEEFKKFRML